MGGALTAFALASVLVGAEGKGLGFDPRIDGDRAAPTNWGFGLGLESLDTTFGFRLEARSPRLFESWVFEIAVNLGWFPNVAVGEERQMLLSWTAFGGARARAELALPLAESPHRIFFSAGPSVLVLNGAITEQQLSPGAIGGVGVELFVGDRYRPDPISLAIELGGAAHLSRADFDRGEAAVAESLATGFFLSVALRMYPFERRRGSPRE